MTKFASDCERAETNFPSASFKYSDFVVPVKSAGSRLADERYDRTNDAAISETGGRTETGSESTFKS